MACMQKARPTQAAQLLPTEVSTEQQSLIVVKKLLAIAVSGVTYLRGIFPERAYGPKYVDDQQVMILKGERECPGATQILKWMQGCFDAIQKKYLRIVIMSIYTDRENPQKVTEYYQFKLQYTAEGAHMDFESKGQKLSTMSVGNTRKASVLLVRKLYTLMQNLGPLPENVCLNMKLAYYDDVTPQGYQPPGFIEADSDILEFEQESVRLTMGEVATPFHCVKFEMATEKRRLEQVEASVQVRDRWLVKVQEKVLLQSQAPEELKELTGESTDQDITETQTSLHMQTETCEEVTEALLKKTADLEVGVKRTRSGRIIKSMAKSCVETNVTVSSEQATLEKEKQVSEYQVLSQDSSAASVAKKKRKLSEPKERF
ncbi:HORMA domain-containing protein 1 [Cololabis saira]|uniref:HORMA domain-containing protein 1 n=1 Tax=Cololabis saira TaxID=129043 RepID=UPI002AD1FAD3|nr:HORMA domain-containing protein 1 [Cololabis saira]